MNSNTGEVVHFDKVSAERAEEIKQSRDWVQFIRGEPLAVKGIEFTVHKVSHKRIVLKFKNKQPRPG